MKRTKIKGPDGRQVDAIELSFQNAREHWNEYLLDDGSIIKLKPVATEVFRVEDQFDADGNPLYVIKATNIVVVSAAENLKQKRG